MTESKQRGTRSAASLVDTGATAGVAVDAPVAGGPFCLLAVAPVGNLWPFAANACPNPLRGPPPAAFTWHAPQDFPVWAAYWGSAPAGLGALTTANTPPAARAATASPTTFIFILTSSILRRVSCKSCIAATFADTHDVFSNLTGATLGDLALS